MLRRRVDRQRAGERPPLLLPDYRGAAALLPRWLSRMAVSRPAALVPTASHRLPVRVLSRARKVPLNATRAATKGASSTVNALGSRFMEKATASMGSPPSGGRMSSLQNGARGRAGGGAWGPWWV